MRACLTTSSQLRWRIIKLPIGLHKSQARKGEGKKKKALAFEGTFQEWILYRYLQYLLIVVVGQMVPPRGRKGSTIVTILSREQDLNSKNNSQLLFTSTFFVIFFCVFNLLKFQFQWTFILFLRLKERKGVTFHQCPREQINDMHSWEIIICAFKIIILYIYNYSNGSFFPNWVLIFELRQFSTSI